MKDWRDGHPSTDGGAEPRRVAVAMSGGVDSCVAAALMKAQGHEVIGVTAIMTRERSRCCSDEDVQTARTVAEQLGIPHEVVDVSEAFHREVIEYFMAEYLAGRTPSPCVVCNRSIKFGHLLQWAELVGAGEVATGHYARLGGDQREGRRLFRGRDQGKDQSYFLARLTQEQLRRAVFPLGEMTKAEVVRYATARGLTSRHRRESQELCFIQQGTHGDWIAVRRLDTQGSGDILDTQGRKRGRHLGIHHYTVGQRRGLGLATGAPVYVVRLDAARNTVVVGDRAEASSGSMAVQDLHWIGESPSGGEIRVLTQLRYRHAAAESRLTFRDGGVAEILFAEPQFAVTPGQLAVFYRDDEVLGSGWIQESCP